MRWHSFAATALIAMALLPRAAIAAQLREMEVRDEGKKARAVFSFSESVKAEVISHYANNFVALSISGLNFSKAQTKADHKANRDLEGVYRFIRCVPGAKPGDPGEVRIYLSKPLTPADALVIQNGKSIEIEILKPRGSQTAPSEPAEPDWPAPPAEPPAAEPHIAAPAELQPVESAPAEPASQEPEPAEAAPQEAEPQAEAEDGSGGVSVEPGPQTQPEGSGDSTSIQPPAAGGSTPLGQLPGGSKPHPAPEAVPEEGSSVTEPAGKDEAAGGSVEIGINSRSYQSFDLAQVPVTGVEIRGEPFNEALMQLVAGTGFNVVVGEGVSTETVTLNFAKKQISLKKALDLLCVAYDLVYQVDDDAIVIRGKP